MRDQEKLQLVIRYFYVVESFYKNRLIDIQNNMIKHCLSQPSDVLELYKAQIEYDVAKSISRDFERIIHNFDNFADVEK